MNLDEVKDPILQNLTAFIGDAEFQSTFEQFFLTHALEFTDEEENKLEYMDIYLKFQDLFDSFMKDFMKQNKISEKEFSERCQKAIEDDPNASKYLDIVLASMDFPAFVQLMKSMRRRAKMESSEAKDSLTSDLCNENKLVDFDDESDYHRAESKEEKCIDDNNSFKEK